MRALAAEIAASQTGEEVERLAALFAAESGHATPKVDVRGVAFRASRVLLVRGRGDGLWTLPGGWAEVGETPRQAVEKEVREESGYEVRAVKLIGVHDRDLRDRPRWPVHGYKLFFLCELASNEPAPPSGHETDAVGFFAADDLPPLSQRVGGKGLAWVFDHLRDPSLPAEFD